MTEREYMVVVPSIVGTAENWVTAYACNGVRYPDRQTAITAGLADNGHDDWLIATVEGDRLVGLGWMEEDRHDPEEMAEVARGLNLCVGVTA